MMLGSWWAKIGEAVERYHGQRMGTDRWSLKASRKLAKIERFVIDNVPGIRRYLCERCGGMGHQPEGCWDWDKKLYTSPAGVCKLCNGEGYLGAIKQ